MCVPAPQVPRNTAAAMQRPTDLMLHCSSQCCRTQLQRCFKEKPVGTAVPAARCPCWAHVQPQRHFQSGEALAPLRLPCRSPSWRPSVPDVPFAISSPSARCSAAGLCSSALWPLLYRRVRPVSRPGHRGCPPNWHCGVCGKRHKGIVASHSHRTPRSTRDVKRDVAETPKLHFQNNVGMVWPRFLIL